MIIRATLFVGIIGAAGACLSRCSPSSDLKRETGTEVCPGANVQDLTTLEEEDTTPGFSHHLLLSLGREPINDEEDQRCRHRDHQRDR